MTIRGCRFGGQTYVNLNDITEYMRKEALRIISTEPKSQLELDYYVIAGKALSAKANDLDGFFQEWKDKPDDVQIKRGVNY